MEIRDFFENNTSICVVELMLIEGDLVQKNTKLEKETHSKLN
jgi:hypothetical protein